MTTGLKEAEEAYVDLQTREKEKDNCDFHLHEKSSTIKGLCNAKEPK